MNCQYGEWLANVYEGNYTVWPGLGVEVRHGPGCVELVTSGIIGPPVGPDERGDPELKGLRGDKWKSAEVKGVFKATTPAQKMSMNPN